MKSRISVLLLLVTAACGFYGVAVLAGAQDAPVPPIPPAPPSAGLVPPVPPLPPFSAAAPAEPATPAMPAMPAIPATPAMPAVPAAPASPAESTWNDWDHGHSMSMSGGHREPATDCSDLHVRFDDRDAVMESVERTVTKADAPTLRVRPHKNDGVQVQGWDKDTYSVTSCKFASNEDGGAQRILAQMTISVKNGEVSTNGPSDDGEWTIYLLIRAPRAAVIDLETANGPLSLYSVDGKLTAHATNGPITLRDFSGDADVRAANGPITISGSSGNVRIHTENGPISINLKGTTWSGTGLTADAQNGPLTLSVPSDYKSSFSVESRNYSPMSCHASICEKAQKTWDDNNRRIEFGGSPAMIRLSTVNGPVSIQSSREEM
ncbi:MAG TPA: hypothetical protein VKH63_03195 [Candidatus Acidoferrum sp.]|nr:hypothetical protein [Candidatus Acidoferrum sp.]